jgi:adenylate cyclase
LIEAETSAHLWADRFDGPLEDVFEIQDRVAIAVAGVIEPALQAAEIRRSSSRPTDDLTAYDLYLRALQYSQSADREGTVEALRTLGLATTLDPRYGAALALAATYHADLYVNDWADDPEANRREGLELARRALRAAGNDPGVLARTAYVLGNLGEDIDAAAARVFRPRQFAAVYAVNPRRGMRSSLVLGVSQVLRCACLFHVVAGWLKVRVDGSQSSRHDFAVILVCLSE